MVWVTLFLPLEHPLVTSVLLMRLKSFFSLKLFLTTHHKTRLSQLVQWWKSVRRETQVWSPGQEDPLDKEVATHSSIPAWEIPWTEEPGGLQSTRLQRVGYNWSDWAHMHTSHNDFVLWILHTYCRYHSFKMYHTAFWSSLVVQWLGLSTSTVTAQVQFLVRKQIPQAVWPKRKRHHTSFYV